MAESSTIPEPGFRAPIHGAVRFGLLWFGLASLLIQPCQGGPPGFESTGNLISARSAHTATLLHDGRVLVVGGTNGNGPDCESYNPATRTWTAAASLATPRSGHTATLYPGDRVLVVGGLQYGLFPLGSAELYDPDTDTWTTTGSLQGAPRYGHTATLLQNGVLVAGGYAVDIGYGGYSISSAEFYNPETGTWTATGNMTSPRSAHTATLLANGKVLVAGGYNRAFGYGPGPIDGADLYDPVTGTWVATGSLGAKRYGDSATLVGNGKVLVGGGAGPDVYPANAELYDPATETWLRSGTLVRPRVWHAATFLTSGRVLIAGGSFDGNVLTNAELYDPANQSWADAGDLINARAYHTATLLQDGTVLIVGGKNGDTVLNTAEIYREPARTPTLLNISTRLDVQIGNNATIGGFIITGIAPKTVIVRGIGPSLGLPGTLADPVIEVYDGTGVLRATNDNWIDADTRKQIMDSGLAPTNDLESALWGIINPGAYTVVVRGKNGGTGLGLFEVYDLDNAVNARLANVSTRGLVQTGDSVLIGGFISGRGTAGATTKVLVRALGPSIPGVSPLSDPTLELHDSNGGLIDSNDNWKVRPDGSSQQAEIEATTIPPTDDLESALLTTVGFGSFTAIVRGQDGTIGIGLVEVYRLQE